MECASEKKYVQFGSGLCGPEGWLNYDISPTLRLQRLPLVGSFFNKVGPKFPSTIRYGDVVTGLPLPDQSCEAVYSSHVLEHLALNDMRTALSNVHRLLVPGGRFRFVVPDLRRLARDYLNSDATDASVRFMQESYLGRKSRPKGVTGLLRALLGNSGHLWMWDFESMKGELEAAGFADVRRAVFGDSADPKFHLVENHDRWEGCLGIECVRVRSAAALQTKAA